MLRKLRKGKITEAYVVHRQTSTSTSSLTPRREYEAAVGEAEADNSQSDSQDGKEQQEDETMQDDAVTQSSKDVKENSNPKNAKGSDSPHPPVVFGPQLPDKKNKQKKKRNKRKAHTPLVRENKRQKTAIN